MIQYNESLRSLHSLYYSFYASGDSALRTQHALLDMAIRKIGNRYLATMLIAKRIRQLQHGARALVTPEEGESYFTVTVREIAEGHLSVSPGTGIRPHPALEGNDLGDAFSLSDEIPSADMNASLEANNAS